MRALKQEQGLTNKIGYVVLYANIDLHVDIETITEYVVEVA